MFAAGGGHNDTTKLLIEAGADVNVAVVATPEYIEQVKAAIAQGKEDVEQHKNGVTALSIAAQGGHIGTIKLLVEAGANVSSVDDDGFTPLLNAVKSGFYKVAAYLLDYGANANDEYVDEKGVQHNLLMDAITTNRTEFAFALIDKGANLTYADSDGVTLLTQAAYLGYTDIVKYLLHKEASCTEANKEGINPLIAAASEGHLEIVKELLECKDVDVDSRDKDETNALMAASVRGHKDVVLLLLENKASVNAQNIDGHTALMFAYNGKNQVETLLDKYSEYIRDEKDTSTKMIMEALQSHSDVVELLLKYGADPTLKVGLDMNILNHV
jgi:ankyrin repeat protein